MTHYTTDTKQLQWINKHCYSTRWNWQAEPVTNFLVFSRKELFPAAAKMIQTQVQSWFWKKKKKKKYLRRCSRALKLWQSKVLRETNGTLWGCNFRKVSNCLPNIRQTLNKQCTFITMSEIDLARLRPSPHDKPQVKSEEITHSLSVICSLVLHRHLIWSAGTWFSKFFFKKNGSYMKMKIISKIKGTIQNYAVLPFWYTQYSSGLCLIPDLFWAFFFFAFHF